MEISTGILCIIILTMLLGVGAIAGIGYLYRYSYPRQNIADLVEMERVHAELMNAGGFRDPTTCAVFINRYIDFCGDTSADYLDKRQNYWNLLVRFSLSLLIVVFIVILLILKIITAEAGLPILGAFGGAAISQGISSAGRAPTRSHAEPTGLIRRE